MPLLTSLDELDTDPVDAELSVNNSEAKAEKKGDKNKMAKVNLRKRQRTRCDLSRNGANSAGLQQA